MTTTPFLKKTPLLILVCALFFITAHCTPHEPQTKHDIVALQKSIYAELGRHTVPQIVARVRPEFDRLNANGTLAATLDALYEMRMMDLHISIQHAKKMRKVLEVLGN